MLYKSARQMSHLSLFRATKYKYFGVRALTAQFQCMQEGTTGMLQLLPFFDWSDSTSCEQAVSWVPLLCEICNPNIS